MKRYLVISAIIAVITACALRAHADDSTTPQCAPAAPAAPTVTETAPEGTVTLSWTAPGLDEEGNPVDPSTLTYTVYSAEGGEPLATGLTGLSINLTAVAPDERAFVSYRVSASDSHGESRPSEASAPLPVGAPYMLPFDESFAGSNASKIWSQQTTGEAEWLVTPYSSVPMTYSHDNDGGMLAFVTTYPGVRASIETGKIYLGTGSDPCLKFWMFNMNSRPVGGDITVYIDAGEGFEPIRVLQLNAGRPDGWYENSIQLSQFTGKTIRLRFTGWCGATDVAQLIDDIRIRDIGNDMSISRIATTDKITPGNMFEIQGTVMNNCSHTVSQYEVRLYRDGQLVETVAGLPTAPYSTRTYTFVQRAEPTWSNRVLYSIEVVADGDNLSDNNMSDTIAVLIDQNAYPSVSDIKAFWNDDERRSVALTWADPDFNMAETVEYTEGFEYFPPFEPDPQMAGWTVFDYDGAPTYGIDGHDFGWAGERMAFIAIDSEDFTGNVKAKFGSQFLMSMDAMGRQTDDWLFSPLLSGKSQVVSFWVRSLSSTYGTETFQLLGSLGGTEPYEFEVLRQVERLPATWTKYTCRLKEGTRHFAIRNISQEAHGLLVDEITFVPGRHPAENYDILGYNVFRDGEKLNENILTDLHYTDNDLPEVGNPSYAVSVVYDRGESPVSIYIEPVASGLTSVEDLGAEALSVNGGILINSPVSSDFMIHNIEGICVYQGNVTDSVTVPLREGLYIVTARGFTRKVIVGPNF